MDQNLRSKFKIVVVDDSDYARRNIISILENAGFHIAGQASSAEEAIKLSVTIHAHLYIIDIVMPEVSGLELTKFLSEKKKGLSIIMISSLSMDNLVVEAITNGASDYLKKPFDPQDLINSVLKIASLHELEKST